MTAKQLFKATLIELSKASAPPLKLYEFNYYFNKAINQYINTVYNKYDMNQQTTDDIRVLQTSIYMVPEKIVKADQPLVQNGKQASSVLSAAHHPIQSLYGAAYQCWLPMDYLHLLNCVCTFEVLKPYDCYDQGSFIQKPATRLTSDSWPLVMDDVYNRPTHERPYYQVYNQHREDTDNTLPIDPSKPVDKAANGSVKSYGTDIDGKYSVTEYDSDYLAKDAGNANAGNLPRTFTFRNGFKESLVERTAAQRIGNPTNVRLEIRYGRDDTLFKLREVQVDYLKTPQYIRLSQEQLDLTQDVSQMLEWPDYICQEIANILIRLIMERASDPRLGNNMQINQTIARPQETAQAR